MIFGGFFVIIMGQEDMGINILTSGFPGGFTKEFAELLHRLIIKKDCFVFVASEFEKNYNKTDKYFGCFLQMFKDIGIEFERTLVVDGRMTFEEAQKAVSTADVLWLAGGDTLAQFKYIKSYGLIPIMKERNGITIGMSAGSINMAKTAICTVTCGHSELKIYPAIGLVDITVEPHLDCQHVSDELLQLSESYPIYGMCDNSVIVVEENKTLYLGDVFLIDGGIVKRIE